MPVKITLHTIFQCYIYSLQNDAAVVYYSNESENVYFLHGRNNVTLVMTTWTTAALSFFILETFIKRSQSEK